jgi:phosphoribosylformylglycinamidine synthase
LFGLLLKGGLDSEFSFISKLDVLCKNRADASLYAQVESCSNLQSGGSEYPNRKDSLSMKQKVSNEEVIAPGTVIISA